MNRCKRPLGALAIWYVFVATAKVFAAESGQPPNSGSEPPLVQVMRGENTWLGRFDGNGNFIREPRYPANYGRIGGSGISFSFVSIGGQRPVYEHRSGRLIRGTSIDRPHSVFVPEIGSTVIDITKFDLKKPDRLVWNLTETTAAFWTEERKQEFPNGLPKGTEPPKAGTPAGSEFIPFSKLRPGKPPKQARAIGDVLEFGHLSDEGEFFPDPDLPSISRAGIRTPIKDDPFGVPRYYTVPHPPWDRGPKQEGQKESDPEPVYEFRSGRLIKGMLQATGNFVPELGSKVTDFKDYDPNERRRIYNLPGVLRPVEKK